MERTLRICRNCKYWIPPPADYDQNEFAGACWNPKLMFELKAAFGPQVMATGTCKYWQKKEKTMLLNKNDFDHNFNRDFDRVIKFTTGWFIFIAILGVGGIFGFFWIAVRILQHFGII